MPSKSPAQASPEAKKKNPRLNRVRHRGKNFTFK